MPFHTLAFTKLDGAAAVNEDIPGVSDQWAPFDASQHFTLQMPTRLKCAYFQDAGALNARINTPTLRYINLPSIQPVNVTGAPVSLSPKCFYDDTYLDLPKLDPIALEASNSGAGGVRAVGGLWVAAGDMGFTPGSITTLRCTGTISATLNAWTFGNFAFDQTLPAGRYQVVGLDVVGAGLVFARLVFTGGSGVQGMRPGVIARPTVLIYQDMTFRMGNFGLFGVFDSTAPPGLEVFATAANSAQTIFIDVIRIG